MTTRTSTRRTRRLLIGLAAGSGLVVAGLTTTASAAAHPAGHPATSKSVEAHRTHAAPLPAGVPTFDATLQGPAPVEAHKTTPRPGESRPSHNVWYRFTAPVEAHKSDAPTPGNLPVHDAHPEAPAPVPAPVEAHKSDAPTPGNLPVHDATPIG